MATRTARIAAWLAAVMALALALLVAGAWWSVRSERGTVWLLSLLPGVRVDLPRGRLLGDFAAEQIRVQFPGGEDQLILNGFAWHGLSIARGAAPLWLRVRIDSLEIARIDIVLVPATAPKPPTTPSDLRLPVELDVGALRVQALYATQLGSEPLRNLRARVHLGADAGAEHRIEDLTSSWDRLQATGQARIASAAPMTLAATLRLTQQAGSDTLPGWNASATLAGPLAAPRLQATLRAAAARKRPAQSFDLRATLRPFEAWPLGDLQMDTQALDLSAFSSVAPATALSGNAVARSTAVDQPASVSAELTNALPGRWNEGKLPAHRLGLELAARPDEPNVLTLRRLDVALGTPTTGAGQLTGQGRWAPDGWALDATLADARPALLDARAPAVRASGPIALSGSGSTMQIKTELNGEVQGLKAARSVQLKLDASVSPKRIELRDAQALAGGARATFKGLVTFPTADIPWAVKLDGRLVDFDPAVWWPGREDATWRRKPSRVNSTMKVDVTLPVVATTGAPLAMLAALRGEAALTLTPSVLAGVPISGSADLRNTAGTQVETVIDLLAEGNRVHATGSVAASGDGASDAWDLIVTGPALGRLAPVYALLTGDGGGSQKVDLLMAGTLNAKVRARGRWPALTTQGQFEADKLRIGAMSAQHAQGRWSLGTSLTAQVDAQVTVTQASVTQADGTVGPSIESATLQLQGTGRAHTLELRADSKAQAPAWIDTMQGAETAPDARTVGSLRVQGGLVDQSGAGLAGWRGTLQQLELRSSSTAAADRAPLLRSRDVQIEALWAGGPPRATLQPGRAEVLGGALRWSRIAWSAAARDGDHAQIDAQVDVDPIRIAPLLTRVQPTFGWGGDLAVGAHLVLRSAPTFHAEVVIERSGGDLTVTEEAGGTRALGLTDLRLGLAADNGVWNFTQGVAGKTVGVAAGAVVVRTAPQATWPPADAPIDGVLELQVADLGTWGPWVPPGWRLGGALRASAGINGRFGAPEYTGMVTGSQLSVRNFLQGVNVREGDVAIRLRGTTAEIERFTAKAGNGSLALEGNASLGEAPKAVLRLKADQFQLLGRVDRRIVSSGNGRLQLDAKSLAFDGEFKVDEGLIDFTRSDAPTLSDDVEVVRADTRLRGDAGTGAAQVGRAVALDVRVGLGDKLRLRGRGLDTGLAGELRITSPGGRLAINGTVRAVDGTYAAYGQKLAIDRGVITFNGAIENPRLDIEATRPNLDVRVGVAVVGSATNPRVRLFSEPELSEIDKLSWLVMGRASDGLGRTDTALLQRAALALLAGEGGGPTDQLTKAIGLDEIGVRQSDGEVRETIVSLGKQLSRRWYVGYERGLNATTGNFQLIYRIARRFTLRAQSGEDNSLDLIWTWRWK